MVDVATNSRFETKTSRGQRVKALMEMRKMRTKATNSKKTLEATTPSKQKETTPSKKTQEEEDDGMNKCNSKKEGARVEEDFNDLRTGSSLTEETVVSDSVSNLDGEDITLDLTVRTNRLPEEKLTVTLSDVEKDEEETVFSDVWNTLENKEEESSASSKEQKEVNFVVDEISMEFSETFDDNTHITHAFSTNFEDSETEEKKLTFDDAGNTNEDDNGDHCSIKYSYFNGENTILSKTFEDENTLQTPTIEGDEEDDHTLLSRTVVDEEDDHTLQESRTVVDEDDDHTLQTRTFDEDDHTLKTFADLTYDEAEQYNADVPSPTSLLVDSFQSLFQCNNNGGESQDDSPFEEKAQKAAFAVQCIYSEGACIAKEIIGEMKEDWKASLLKKKMGKIQEDWKVFSEEKLSDIQSRMREQGLSKDKTDSK